MKNTTTHNLLKEAIADAKLIKATAEKNARTAIEEAFAPRIQSMISRKIAEDTEMEDELDPAAEEEQFDETFMFETEEGEDEFAAEDEFSDEGGEDEFGGEGEAPEGDEFSDGAEDEFSDDGEAQAQPNPRQRTQQPIEKSYVGSEEDNDDLEEALRYLDEDDATLEDELDLSEGDGEDFEIEIEDDDDAEMQAENRQLKKDLAEAIRVIKYMKKQMNESNLLNSKLHYCNQVFKKNALTESQKAKVLNVFDKATNMREVKLAYTAINESLTKQVAVAKKPIAKNKNFKQYMKESFASKPIKSTKPSQRPILDNNDEFVSRMQRLAGLGK